MTTAAATLVGVLGAPVATAGGRAPATALAVYRSSSHATDCLGSSLPALDNFSNKTRITLRLAGGHRLSLRECRWPEVRA
jgi:hypothetical protein